MTTKETLETLLMSIPGYRAQTPVGTEVLNKTLLNDLARHYDKALLDALYGNDALRSHFFTVLSPSPSLRLLPSCEPVKQSTSGSLIIFKLEVFLSFINSYEFLPDSYTRYKQKIGLGFDAGYYLRQLGGVVLNFPYKDCVLKGGQTKDDEKRAEVFFNTVLAPDEVNRLLDDKAFKGWTRYTKDGEVPVGTLRLDDNLIIKGNNLVVLHSLMRRYGGKVKLIYIDPPYNTGSDSFGYNDNFNHSSWLVFMKNRLEAARQLLSDDGCIFVQCDDNEQAYLKVLMDEVMGRENFRNMITWKRRGGSANPKNRLNNVVDYILWYSKSDAMEYKQIFTLEDEKTQQYIKERFVNVDENGRRFMKSPLQSPNPRPNLRYEYKGYKVPANGWSISKDIMEQWDAEGKLCFPDSKSKNINRKVYLDEYQGQPVSSLWTDLYVINPMSNEAIEFDGQKPEALLSRIIELSTRPGDLVLDYHLGSGTTAAVAHKMRRQYIGVEQMDYIQSVTVERLRKVIAGEQGGVPKQAEWTGGGEFVYCEVANDAARYIERINKAADKELDRIMEESAAASCINYKVTEEGKKFEHFDTLADAEKRQLLVDCLDLNDLYVNMSESEDAAYGISEGDKGLSRQFYGW